MTNPAFPQAVFSRLESGTNRPWGRWIPAVLIRITDAGCGIRPENLSRVFDPFYSGRTGGTGLGLALVKHYIEEMGGAVEIFNNDPHPGCSAEVHIPRSVDTQSSVVDYQDAGYKQADQGGHAGKSRAAGSPICL